MHLPQALGFTRSVARFLVARFLVAGFLDEIRIMYINKVVIIAREAKYGERLLRLLHNSRLIPATIALMFLLTVANTCHHETTSDDHHSESAAAEYNSDAPASGEHVLSSSDSPCHCCGSHADHHGGSHCLCVCHLPFAASSSSLILGTSLDVEARPTIDNVAPCGFQSRVERPPRLS